MRTEIIPQIQNTIEFTKLPIGTWFDLAGDIHLKTGSLLSFKINRKESCFDMVDWAYHLKNNLHPDTKVVQLEMHEFLFRRV